MMQLVEQFNQIDIDSTGRLTDPDCNEHGTRLSGIIGALTNNYGFCPVALTQICECTEPWNVKNMPRTISSSTLFSNRSRISVTAVTLLTEFLCGYSKAFTAYIAGAGGRLNIFFEVDTAVEEFGEQAKAAEPTIKEEQTGFLSFSRGTLLKNILRATQLATSVVHNEPTRLATLPVAKVPDAFYDSLEGRIPASVGVLQAIPNAMGAFHLNHAGTE
ncbi:hypothetical protein JCM5350_002393 [Sporobolomyces pararoseus]